MALLRAGGPYIWVTWLTKLLSDENSCEWAAWFRSPAQLSTARGITLASRVKELSERRDGPVSYQSSTA